MSNPLLLLLVAGSLVSFAAGIWLLIAAFKQSILWGLACLFLSPFSTLVFIITHWQEAKKPFFLSLLGAAMMIGPLLKMEPTDLSPGRPDTMSTRSMPTATRPTTPSGSGFARPAGTPVSPLTLADSGTPAAPEASAEQPTPPPGILPEPLPPPTPSHAQVELKDLASHRGEVLRFRMRDGRWIMGTLRSVENDNARIERSIGMGTSSFTLRLSDVEQVLARR